MDGRDKGRIRIFVRAPSRRRWRSRVHEQVPEHQKNRSFYTSGSALGRATNVTVRTDAEEVVGFPSFSDGNEIYSSQMTFAVHFQHL